MLELLLSLDHEASKLFDWLEPGEILNLTCVNHSMHKKCEQWCQTRGIPRQVAMKRAEIAGICDCLEQMQVPHRLSIRTSSLAPRLLKGFEDLDLDSDEEEEIEEDEIDDEYAHPMEFHEPWTSQHSDLKIGLALLFQSYQGFLEALLHTPIGDTVVNLTSWSKRYWMVSQPRPPAIRQQFDFGYQGYWCDTFGCGLPNDYFRLVGDAPNSQYWSLCLAGSDAHHIRWRNVANGDRTLDPVPSPCIATRKKASDAMSKSDKSITMSDIHKFDEPTEWDRTRQYWRDCGAQVRSSCKWRLDV